MCNSNEYNLAFAITIFMADGRPDGVRVLKKANWDGVGIICPRGRFAEVSKKRAEFKRSGVYVLIGDDNEGDNNAPKQQIYVGETESLGSRLKQQDDEREFWRQVVVFTKQSDDTPLNKAAIKYLESRLQQKAEESGRCCVVKGRSSETPALSEEDEAAVKGYLNEMLPLLAAVGVRVFEGVPRKEAQAKIYECKGKDSIAHAHGYETNDRKFVVQEGSIADKRGNLNPHTLKVHKRLVSEGILEEMECGFRFARNCEFNSPSQAASIVWGRQANGLRDWKDKDGGNTLGDDRERAAE